SVCLCAQAVTHLSSECVNHLHPETFGVLNQIRRRPFAFIADAVQPSSVSLWMKVQRIKISYRCKLLPVSHGEASASEIRCSTLPKGLDVSVDGSDGHPQ